MKKESVISWFDVIKLAIGIMVGVTPMLLVFINYSEKEFNSQKKDVPQHPKIEIVEKQDTIYEDLDDDFEYKMTAEEILKERENLRYVIWVDSVYMTIPDEILVYIVNEDKTDRSSQGIVEEYIANKKKYHQFLHRKQNDSTKMR